MIWQIANSHLWNDKFACGCGLRIVWCDADDGCVQTDAITFSVSRQFMVSVREVTTQWRLCRQMWLAFFHFFFGSLSCMGSSSERTQSVKKMAASVIMAIKNTKNRLESWLGCRFKYPSHTDVHCRQITSTSEIDFFDEISSKLRHRNKWHSIN